MAYVEYVNAGGGSSTPIERRSVVSNTRRSVVGRAWGSKRSVIDTMPERTCGIRSWIALAASTARSKRIVLSGPSAASIERDVSMTKNASASVRSGTVRSVPMTGCAAAIPSRRGTAATAATSGAWERREGSSSCSWLRILVARRSRNQ